MPRYINGVMRDSDLLEKTGLGSKVFFFYRFKNFFFFNNINHIDITNRKIFLSNSSNSYKLIYKP